MPRLEAEQVLLALELEAEQVAERELLQVQLESFLLMLSAAELAAALTDSAQRYSSSACLASSLQELCLSLCLLLAS